MRNRFQLLLPLAAALVLASCAGPAKLAQQSDEALAKGDLSKAYDRALRAVEKDPLNAQARGAYTRASARVADDYKARVRALAAADSLGAADLALRFRAFRNTVAQHGSPLPSDDRYVDDENRIVTAAAREYYGRGREAMVEKRPKQAWRDFGSCLAYVPDYRDAQRRQQDAWRAARTRVAVLPFEDGIRVRGLREAVAEQLEGQLPGHAGSMTFTEFVAGGQVADAMTVSQAAHMTAEDAIALGRHVGADRVVTGRFVALRSNNDLKDLSIPIYRRVERKNKNDETVVSWDPSTLRVITREREVKVNWDFEVIDVKSGIVVAHREVPADAVARIVWTDYRPEGNPNQYHLLPPDVRKRDSSRAKQVDSQWQERVGSWKLADLLLKARDARGRSKWSRDYRREFHGTSSRQRPVWLGELPGEDDLAFVALEDAWRPVLSTLQELDGQD